MATDCKLPRFPRNPSDGARVCDKYGNRWDFAGDSEAWISKGKLNTPITVTESQDGVVTPSIYDKLARLRTYVAGGLNLRPLKILPGTDAYWYYFRSSDKFVRFTPESEEALRIEVDRGRFFQVIYKEICPGERGETGVDGDRGKAGDAGPAEICYEAVVAEKRLDFAIYTPVPLVIGGEIELPNDHVPDISVRIFKTTLPSTRITASSKKSEPMDQLRHLAVYFHGMPAEAAKFQRTRDLLIQQSLGATTDEVCSQTLSKVAAVPFGTRIEKTPAVTILIDPTGKQSVRLSAQSIYKVDTQKSIKTISYDPETGLVCGSVYLTNALGWNGTYCVKSRQMGPDGIQGRPGTGTVRIVEATLDSTSVVATCPIITARVDIEQQTIFTICSDIVNLICVKKVQMPAGAAALSDKGALDSVFAAGQMILDDCKLIYRYQVALADDDFGDLSLAYWEPQPGCVSRRHYNRHKFDWKSLTQFPACDTVRWYDASGGVREASYPWPLVTGQPPEKDECCQEDFFYCPNIQVGGCITRSDGSTGPLPPPPPPQPPPPAPPPPSGGGCCDQEGLTTEARVTSHGWNDAPAAVMTQGPLNAWTGNWSSAEPDGGEGTVTVYCNGGAWTATVVATRHGETEVSTMTVTLSPGSPKVGTGVLMGDSFNNITTTVQFDHPCFSNPNVQSLDLVETQKVEETPTIQMPLAGAPSPQRQGPKNWWQAHLDYSGQVVPSMAVKLPLEEHFNSSIIVYKGQYLMASRKGWRGSRLYLSELADNLKVTRTVEIVLPDSYLHGGFDDPRLFVHRGQLHLSFAFIEIGPKTTSKQCLMRLKDDDWQPEKVWQPVYDKANDIEKNWIFFSHADQILAIYSIHPHLILKVDGKKATELYKTDKLLPWSGGYLRGGTPPVRVGDEYISFFHGAVDGPTRRTYNIGVYAFMAEPPFEVTRITPAPLLWADPSTRPVHVPPNVVWPGGAVRTDGKWLVSVGLHDWWTELMFWDDEVVNNALRKV